MRDLKWSLLIHVLLIGFIFGLSDTSVQLSLETPLEISDLIHAVKKLPKKASSSQNVTPASRTSSLSKDPIPSTDSAPSKNSNEGSGSPDGIDEAVADEFAVSSLPQLINEVRVPYPPEARANGIQGSVQFDLLIASSGQVAQALPIGNPPEILMTAAKKAILQFRFKPAVFNSQPVAVRIRYTYRFVLQ